MKRVVKFLVFAVFMLLYSLQANTVFAADTKRPEDQGVYTGDYKPGVPLEDMSGKTGQYPMGMGYPGETKMPGDKNLLLEKEKAKKELKIPSAESPQKKAKILLKVEPGDGLISLTWRVTGLQLKPGELPLKFTVFYGTESGRYDKKHDVGNVSDYKLRDLKNNQVYYIKVQGATQIQEEGGDGEPQWTDLTILSSEMNSAPQAVEELGSSLERSFASKTYTMQERPGSDPFKRELKQFGYDFFKNSLATTSPTDNVPVGADYIVGPGDSLRIDLWGSIQARYEVTVDRNGEITIPKVGTVKVWGTKYGEAKDVINRAISRYFKGYELNVTLGKLRTIQVFVVGEVELPGTYTISSLGTVINALSLAGGPSKNGSLRSIQLSRGGKVVQEIDLYDMFLAGDRSKDIRLENGDTIFVPVIGFVAGVGGEVKRPGIFELKGKTSLPQVLGMAGGITAAGDTSRIQVERFEGNAGRVVHDFESKPGKLEESLADVQVHDRDMIKVFPVHKALRQVVSLQGSVVSPGEYQYREGMRVSDIIPNFAYLLPGAFPRSAEIIRLVLPEFHREKITFNLRKAIEGDEKENILLREQDTIRVFSTEEMAEKPTVSINGQVVNPGIFDFYPHMTVRDLVTAAGSPKRNAFLDSAELTRIAIVDGKAQSIRVELDLSKALAGNPDHNLALQPDDVLIVRGIAEWLESTDRLVTLKGEVRFPGVYSITKGERVSSLISRAGGFTERAYLKGAKFTRKSVKEMQQKRMDEMIEKSEQDILKKQGELASLSASKEELEATKSALEGLMKSLDKLKEAKAEGRVVIHLASVEELKKSPYDLELMGGDSLEIPQTPSVVSVIGQVYNPATLVHRPGADVSSYLKLAGGPTREAEVDDMYIVKADGSVASKQQSSFGIRWDEESRSWTFGSFMGKALDPGDTLIVPQKLERVAWMRDIKDIASILGNIALVAGVIVAAGL